MAVVPNGTAPALKQPYLPGQYTEYPAAVQGLAQQALPGGKVVLRPVVRQLMI